jgi:hypothetical protein
LAIPSLESVPGALEIVVVEGSFDGFACLRGASFPVGLEGLSDLTAQLPGFSTVMAGVALQCSAFVD